MKNLTAVFLGMVGVAVSGAILFPLVYLSVDKFLHIFEKGNPGDDFFLAATFILWAVISSFVGGWVAARSAANKPLKMAVITGVITTLMLLILFWFNNGTGVEWELILYSLIPVPFAYLGGWTGNYYLKKKSTIKQSDDLNV